MAVNERSPRVLIPSNRAVLCIPSDWLVLTLTYSLTMTTVE